MPASRTAEPDRPTWAYTDRGKVVACPKGPPEGSVLVCREGDTSWQSAEPPRAARPAGVAVAAGPGMYDEPEAR